MDIVLDTNCLIMSLSPRGRYSLVWQKFMQGRYTLCVTTSILEEYEEVISRNISARAAKIVLSLIVMQPNVRHIDPHFSFGLIEADVDDNKFVDCAIAANARYIVTEDHHFDVLRHIAFPKVEVMRFNAFFDYLQEQ